MPRTSETETHQAQTKHTPHTPVRRTPRRKLDARDDEIILDVLLADRRANNLRRPRWTHMARLLTARTNDPRAVTAKQVQSRADRLCDVYDIIRRCIDSGMEWNEKRGCFVEHVRRDNALWAHHLARLGAPPAAVEFQRSSLRSGGLMRQNHPEAAQWRWRSWPLYSRAHRLWSLDPPKDSSDESPRSEVQPKRRGCSDSAVRSNQPPRRFLGPTGLDGRSLLLTTTESRSGGGNKRSKACENLRRYLLASRRPKRLVEQYSCRVASLHPGLPQVSPALQNALMLASSTMEAIRVVLESFSSLRYQIEAIQIVCETSFLTAEEKVRLVVFFLHNQPFAHTLVILKDSDSKEPVLRSWL
ncbi:hypothetical protein DB88DRAFT_475535 [Papiliotrema laurentii]|uniref:Myb/SANT-like domain-containing protein n=1 Tax=Papiliotrema laurentii TaxID=5418 RepID=A0AAD9CSB0_PAPLA|nr:hypothetical protein DB88DRAFT_475535 [Papiliotrema laurentii]